MFYLVLECPLPSLTNIHYNPNKAFPGTLVQVTCDGGYILEGPANITCHQDNTFRIQIQPTCRRK